ncbi:MAG: flagellar biosynthesis anti-sigma factor FlgM [Planctomycetota bacterium]
MPDRDLNRGCEGQNQHLSSVNNNQVSDEDLLMEQILENINNTPIGQVLKKIALLPEVRKEKVLEVRRQLTEGKYNLNERLDIALDRVLEDLTA